MNEVYKERREKMVEEQIRARGLLDENILSVMLSVPRHLFVEKDQRERAYCDHPLPIGFGQTISQPYIVALMTHYLELSGKEKVLEIGTGSGYQAAILSKLAKEVYTIERIEPLAKRAESLLRKLGISNVYVKTGNGSCGLSEDAPFDRIILTCASFEIPKPLKEQLADGGIIVAPIGEKYAQTLIVAKKKGKRLVEEDKGGCIFVPLVGKFGWSEE
jgi:protein-L-isoaspartate(D-aspartate) O-methyltransferase